MQLQLQLQLQDEMMNRLFTCKIKEHKDFNLVMEGLEGLVNSSYRWVYSCNYNCKYKSKRIVCDNGFAHGAREIGAKMITNMEQENCVKDVSINDIIEKDVVKEMGNHVMINRINWKIN